MKFLSLHAAPVSTALVITSLFAFPSVANDTPSLKTITVSAARIEMESLPVASQITVITRDDIRKSGAVLLGDVLRSQAGLSWSDSDGSRSRTVTFSMRGMAAANNTLVLVDGRKLNNPTQASPALNTIALKDVERIEIVQGSSGVLYGDQAVGGVINIVTRTADKNKVQGSVTAGRGSFNEEDYSASVHAGFTNGTYFSGSAQKRQSDNFRDNNESDYENLLLKLGYRGTHGGVFVEGQRIDDALRLAGSLLDSDAAIDPRQTFSPNDFSDQVTDVWRAGGELGLSSEWVLIAEYSDRNEEGLYFYDNYYGGGSPRPTQYSLRAKNFTPRVVGNYGVSHGQAVFTIGYDATDAAYESDNGWAPADATQKQQSVYAQAVYPLTAALTTTVGARWSEVDDKNHLTVEQFTDDLVASEVGVNYAVGNGWRLFSRVAEGFRFATPDDNNGRASSTPFLRPQTSISYEAGAEWSRHDARVSYSVYRMELDDEILFDPIQYVNRNLPSSERSGFVVDSAYTLSNEWSLLVNYHYLQADVSEGLYQGNEVPFTSEHTGAFTARFTPAKDLTFSLESLYTGARFKADDDANSAGELEAMTLFTLSVAKESGPWSIVARIDNLTDKRYAGYYSVWGQYPQTGRRYSAGVTYQF
jgi:iron complex outermembrane receptor protein